MNGKNGYSATTEMVTIYSPDGDAQTMSRANAGDLIRHNGFTWAPGDGDAAPAPAPVAEPEPTPEPEPEIEAEEEDDDEEDEVQEGQGEEEVADDLDYDNAPLADIAEQLVGERDVAQYLARFSADQLRDMAASRYGERVHHAAKADTIIEKIVGWEEELNGA